MGTAEQVTILEMANPMMVVGKLVILIWLLRMDDFRGETRGRRSFYPMKNAKLR